MDFSRMDELNRLKEQVREARNNSDYAKEVELRNQMKEVRSRMSSEEHKLMAIY